MIVSEIASVAREVDRTVVWLRGEHDTSTAVELSLVIAEAIALDDADVVVDLSDVEFMGAATVGVIVRSRELLRTRSRTLLLRSPSRCARRVLDLCDLSYVVDAGCGDVTLTPPAPGALGTWVAVPATDRDDREDASVSTRARTDDLVSAAVARSAFSAQEPGSADGATSSVAGREGR